MPPKGSKGKVVGKAKGKAGSGTGGASPDTGKKAAEDLKSAQSEQSKLNKLIQEQQKNQEKSNKNTQDQTKKLQESAKESKKVTDSVKNTSSAFSSLTPKLKQLASGLQKAGMEAANIPKQMGKLGGAIASTMSPLANLAKRFLSVSSIVGFLQQAYARGQEAVVRISNQNVELARTIGLAQGAASGLAGQARGIGAAMGITNAQATQAMGSIYAALDSTEKLSGSTLNTFMRLNVFAGVAADTLAELSRTAKITGQDAGKFADAVADTSLSFIKANKMAVSMRSVMDGVAKVSASVKLTLGGSAEAITKAVLTSKKLGMELQKIEDIANGLLNLEDSISAEMEAELLTGKDLNLEKAREAALNNDNVGLMEELAKNIGTAEEFSKMNRTQQDAYAKAVGMSREELAQTLANQKAVVAEQGNLVDGQQDGLKSMQSTASAGEALQNRQEALDAGFIGIYNALRPLVYALQNMAVQIAGPIAKALGALVPIIMPIVRLFSEVLDVLGDLLIEMLPPLVKILEGLVDAARPFLEGFMELVRSVMPVIVQILNAVIPLITGLVEAFKPFFEAISNLVKTLAPELGKLIEAIVPVLLEIANAIAPFLTAFVDMAAKWLPQIVDLFINLILPAIQAILTALQPILDVWMQLADKLIPVVIDVVKMLVPIIVEIVNALAPVLEMFYQILMDNLEPIKSILMAVGQVIMTIMNLLKPVLDIFMQLAQTLIPVILNLINTLIPIINNILKSLQPFFDALAEMMKTILPVIAKVFEKIGELVSRLFTKLQPILDMVIQLAVDLLPLVEEIFMALLPVIISLVDALMPILDIIIAIIKPILAILIPIVKFLLGLFVNIVEVIAGALKFVFDIIGAIGEYLVPIIEVVSGIFTAIVGIIGGIIDAISSFIDLIVDGVVGAVSWVGDAFNKVGDTIKSIGTAIKGFLIAPINMLIEGVNWFIDAINEALHIKMPEWLGGGEWSPNISKLELIPLAEGGIVSSPTTALIGEAGPEAVIPLDKFANMLTPLVQALMDIAQYTKGTYDILLAVGKTLTEVIGGLGMGSIFGGGGGGGDTSEMISALTDGLNQVGQLLMSFAQSLISGMTVMAEALSGMLEAISFIAQSLTVALPVSMAADEAAIEYFKTSIPTSGISKEENSAITNRMDALIPAVMIMAETNMQILEANNQFYETMSRTFPELVTTNKEQLDILEEIKDRKAIVELDGNKVGEAIASTFSGLF